MLSSENFALAQAAFEGMMAAQADRHTSDSEPEMLGLIERMFPGYRESRALHLVEERKKIQTIKYGNLVKKDGNYSSWFSGPRTSKGEWPNYRKIIESRLPLDSVDGIDKSTDRILDRCANPYETGSKRKGLVVGYVQSGKTANYAALIAKAVDSGYRIVIVLAGMHTNLRKQTQIRLEQDLHINDASEKIGIAWAPLTDRERDIAKKNGVGFLSSSSNVAVMVVKKHESRLDNVAKFLESIPDETLRNRAVLIIDDESDQATPNTQGDLDTISTINQRVRDIWKEVKTGTYVAFTATPFANIFMDPNDPQDLYPDDFAMVLPKPTGYLGADSFFDVVQTADAPDESIYKLAKVVPLDDALVLAPKGRDLKSYEPRVVPSLEAAIRWFLIATAIRTIRTHRDEHSSMLIHTSHRVAAHQLLKDVIAEFVSSLAFNRGAEEQEFYDVFIKESRIASGSSHSELIPAWDEVWIRTREIIASITIKIDNGASDDRLVYTDGEPQVVIAIGGGTLSRGLTLEGLVVSYFLRTTNTYDTLLQMGRWFGFRPHYADLVRVWVGPGLLEDYAHLARVEKEIRSEIEGLEREGRTPSELAIRIRNHPGRLQITSSGKMSKTSIVQAGLGGTRRQTVYLDRSADGAKAAQNAARGLVSVARERDHGPVVQKKSRSADTGSVLFQGLRNSDVVDFFRDYWVSSNDPWLQPEAMQDWLQRHGQKTSWNLVLVSGRAKADRFVFDEEISVRPVNRAPMRVERWTPDRLFDAPPAGADVVNIRALMSSADYVLDLQILSDVGILDDSGRLEKLKKDDVALVRDARKSLLPDVGVLLIYVIAKDSEPELDSPTRASMAAPTDMVGVGVVFPYAEDEDDGEFVAVAVESISIDDEPTIFEDNEGDFVPVGSND